MISFYNTLTKKKEEFRSITPGEARMYDCGPTVYGHTHIGHLIRYIMSDTLRRTLEYNGYNVKQVMNITDVGHLTSDADEGEDKMEKKAKSEGKTPWEIAKMYTAEFFDSRRKLNILDPTITCPATEHIHEMQALIKRLFDRGYAYETDDGVYFEMDRFKNYGQLSGNTADKLSAGARIEVNENKKSPYDFALWVKRVGKHANHIMHWDSPWGDGFPGWHIECSAMSMKYLGETFDIHTGGQDNIFPHHDNEIAQSEGATGKKFVNYWVHTTFLTIDGGKMGKSLNNIYTLDDIEKKGIDPMAFRYLCLTTHFRTPLNFTWESLKAAEVTWKGILNFMQKMQEVKKEGTTGKTEELVKLIDETKKRFLQHINDNLNTPQALADIHDMMKNVYKVQMEGELSSEDAGAVIEAMMDFDRVLGILRVKEKALPIPREEIERLIAERNEARKKKDFKRSDEIRDQLKAKGILLEDTGKGQSWKIA
jgi:cysteinyl-tRNA synthetase